MKLQADIDRAAAVLREDGLPDQFNRLLGLTAEKLAAMEEEMAKIGPREEQVRALREQRAARAARQETTPARRPTERPAAAPAARPTTPAATAPGNPEEKTMTKKAKKTAKKKTAKKTTRTERRAAAARKLDQTKAAAAKPSASKDPAKGKTISEIAREQILAGASNQEALDAVKKAHPEGNTNVGNISWYRNDLRKKGLLAPKEPKAA